MDGKNIVVLMALCTCVVKGSELRNLSKGVKAFYDLAYSDLETDDFVEIMEYLDQRFHRKCFPLENNIKTDIKTRDVIEIVGNLEAEMKKISSTLSMIEHVFRLKWLTLRET